MSISGHEEMTTLSTVLETLRERKQDNEFKMSEKGFIDNKGRVYTSAELKIIKTYRFEGRSNPSDSAIVYLIETKEGLLGYSIGAYGVYSSYDDAAYTDFIKEIPIEERENHHVV